MVLAQFVIVDVIKTNLKNKTMDVKFICKKCGAEIETHPHTPPILNCQKGGQCEWFTLEKIYETKARRTNFHRREINDILRHIESFKTKREIRDFCETIKQKVFEDHYLHIRGPVKSKNV